MKHEIIEFNGIKYYKTGQYYYTGSKTSICKALHVAIWESINGQISDGYIIHHIDKNTLNNDISNLQLVTKEEHSRLHSIRNKYNLGKPNALGKLKSNNTSGCPGVFFSKRDNKYIAFININKKRKFLGSFLLFDDAKTAYLEELKNIKQRLGV